VASFKVAYSRLEFVVKLRKILAAFIFFVLPFAAHANNLEQPKINAPLPTAVKTSFDWSGLYVGVIGGYSLVDFRDEVYGAYGDIARGASVGGKIGYNYVLGSSKIILGIEAEYDKAFVIGDTAFWDITYYKNYSTSYMGRIGFDLDSYMPYIVAGRSTGGLTYDTWSTVDYPGWTAGIGTEIALTNNLVGRVEYRYSDFGYTDDFGYSLHLLDSTVRFGLNYYFH